MVNNSDARHYVMSETPNAYIGLSLDMELEQAAQARGIAPNDLAQMPGIHWWMVENDHLCKADLLAWYRLRNKLTNIENDLQLRRSKMHRHGSK